METYRSDLIINHISLHLRASAGKKFLRISKHLLLWLYSDNRGLSLAVWQCII